MAVEQVFEMLRFLPVVCGAVDRVSVSLVRHVRAEWLWLQDSDSSKSFRQRKL